MMARGGGGVIERYEFLPEAIPPLFLSNAENSEVLG